MIKEFIDFVELVAEFFFMGFGFVFGMGSAVILLVKLASLAGVS